jgi:hypothetical protein
MTKPPKPIDPVITAAGQTISVTVADRVYVLRAPTFGEYGQLAARSVTHAVPSDAIFADALRDVVTAQAPEADRGAMLAAITAHEEARDFLDSLYGTHGGDRTSWDADAKREIADAQRALMAAQREREKIEWRFREAVPIVALRRHRLDFEQQERIGLVALCVASIGGELRTLAEADVPELPAQDVLTIAERAAALLRPTPAAEKN